MDLTNPRGRPKIRDMNPTEIGIVIKKRRKAKGFSLWHLAEKCGKAPQTINAIEIGDSQAPQLATVIPIFDALDIPRERAYKLLSPPPNGPTPAAT